MTSAAEYIERINRIVGSDVTGGQLRLNLRWTNHEEGQQVLLKIGAMKHDLSQLSRDVSHSASVVRSSYITEKTRVGKTIFSGLAGSILGRKLVGRFNAAKRDDLRREQVNVLEPYDRVKRLLEDISYSLEQVKAKVETSPEFSILSVPPRVPKPHSERESPVYFLRLLGECKGPFSAEQVRGLLLANAISFDTEVQVQGIETWLRVGAIEQFAKQADRR